LKVLSINLETYEKNKFEYVDFYNKSVEERRNIAANIVESANSLSQVTEPNELYNTYFPVVDFMADKNVDPFEGKNIWKMLYFDAIEQLNNEDVIINHTRNI
jgi:hypothetical protein